MQQVRPIRALCQMAWLIAFISTETTFAASNVVLEKNCSLRLEGEEYPIGSVVLVYKESAGTKKKLAYAQIQKSAGTKAIAKVIKIKDPSQCTQLQGAQTELFRKDETSDSSSPQTLNKLDLRVAAGLTTLPQKGISVDGTAKDSLKLLSFQFNVDVYPMKFSGGNGFIHNSLGLALKFRQNMATPESALTDQDGNHVGKLATSGTDLEGGLVIRVPYKQNTMLSELRFAYLSAALKHVHKFSIEPAGLNDPIPPPASPFYSIQWSGMGIGIRQRYAPNDLFRVNFGALLPLGVSGKVMLSDVKGEVFTSKVSSASGYLIDFSLDYLIKKFCISGGVINESYSGKFQSSAAKEGSVQLNYLFAFLGIGTIL